MTDFIQKLLPYAEKGEIPKKIVSILERFYLTYAAAGQENGYSKEQMALLAEELVERVIYNLRHPYKFDLYHQSQRRPFDYYQFGLEFIRPLVITKASSVQGLEVVDHISKQLEQGDNVILLANHQTETDPQAISLLLEKTYPKLAEEMIFVAGHRVITDPLAIPFSLGRNLLCIYSKNYIENPPELKPEKLAHNQRTMRKMSQLLSEGGKCIYVAPSGGRDRPNAQGRIEVAKFDPNSIEMFWLMAQQATRITHFYPLALDTFHLLPPPKSVEKDLGELRTAKCTPIHLVFGQEVDMEELGTEVQDKRHRRKYRAEYIWQLVNQDYENLGRVGKSI